MSGHSKWSKIKHKKAATDGKKSKIFGQLSRDISVAARSERDPAKNPTLREAITRAKKANLPQANIDRLLSKDAGDITEVTYEGYSSDGAAILIIAATDNTNRTIAEIRTAFKNHGSSLGSPGSVMWKFQKTSTESGISYEVPDNQKLSLSSEQQEKLNSLVNELEENPDVLQVFTDSA